ncbi:MAG: divalent-cation tolerance protein CutA [Alphaproteobacteria bacterium]|nr:divalent-cation tolerance protein CutA [Alphaproteobacteria bacterium]
MPTDAPRFVYITAPSREEALKIGRALVAERLAASANVLPGARSIYWWQGKMEEADEAVLVAKTRAALAGRLVARVKALHSYDCPGIVILPILEGNPDYLAWLYSETSRPKEAT